MLTWLLNENYAGGGNPLGAQPNPSQADMLAPDRVIITSALGQAVIDPGLLVLSGSATGQASTPAGNAERVAIGPSDGQVEPPAPVVVTGTPDPEQITDTPPAATATVNTPGQSKPEER